VPTRWFRHRWDEDRGDEFAEWGRSTWLYATDETGVVEVQVEIYDGGQVLIYDTGHPADHYGQLADQPLDLADLAAFAMSEAEFGREVATLTPLNRP
jgi:hypothetical protein